MFKIRVNFNYNVGGVLQRRQVSQQFDQWSEETIEEDAWSVIFGSTAMDRESLRKHCSITRITVLHETVAFERSCT